MMDILVDFDGTCTTHAFPEIGVEIGAPEVLKKLIAQGHRLILFTMRSDRKERAYLSEAVAWFKNHDIPLYGIQENPTQKQWTDSPKAYGQLLIDDIGLGIPLTFDIKLSDRNFVDWEKVEGLLIIRKLLPPRQLTEKEIEQRRNDAKNARNYFAKASEQRDELEQRHG